ncbi:MAG: hypothetical protein PHS73_00260 [Candidatus Peribacteraceae bacterium]|nr:hypothetical protein [Candidatus Peribacteraceae bacterium]
MPENEQTPEDSNLLEEISYEGDQSPDFDALLQSRPITAAPMGGMSEETQEKVVVSQWHVPCHCIFAKTREGICRAFHVHLETNWEQDQALKEFGNQGAHTIVAKANRSWFGPNDERQLGHYKLSVDQVIHVNTSQWWRTLYDPSTDEVWIDDKIHRVLRKYRGFGRMAQ